ncbi:MAG TPA: hypothetical protein VMG12_06320 [Polyangiaceae bacterium]|nr:hypothetical protein [Polyangiaceae bacterium]
MISSGPEPALGDRPASDRGAPRDGDEGAEAGARRPPEGSRPSLHPSLRRWGPGALELCVSLAAAGALAASGLAIRVDPLDRVGQVSALAGIGFRYVVAGLVGVALLSAASRIRAGAGFDLAFRLACGALAGLTTGFIAAGIVVALRGTPWCLNGNLGDTGRLAAWAAAAQHGERFPFYPPLPVHTLALYASAFDLEPVFAIKHLQIIGTALVGPFAYASWRLLLNPLWALGIGVVSALSLIDPYKPYANMVLIALVPWLVLFFGRMRAAGALGPRRVVLEGALFGAGFGLLYLWYYGWFQWSAPGAVAAALVLFPWRSAGARVQAAGFVGSTTLVFAAIAGRLVWRALSEGFNDDYFYFDTRIDPSYFAMWLWDLPGPVGTWPPPGEVGGVGLFTLLLAAGMGVAIARGRRHVLVTTLGCIIGGAWLLRLGYAQHMWETKLVQLYPRTSIELFYCALVLSGYALYLVLERPRPDAERTRSAGQSPLPSTRFGAFCALLLVFGSAASALTDRYMPAREKPASLRILAWNAHHMEP